MIKMPLFFILITISIDRIYGDGFCDSEQKTTSIYNIGNTVIISQGDTLWKYDVMNNTMAEEGTSVNDIFRDGAFKRVDSAFTFAFGSCKRNSLYCQAIKKANQTVVAIGDMDSGYGYKVYSLHADDTLTSVSDDLPWGLEENGSMSDDFWDKDMNGTFDAIVFSPLRVSLVYATKNNLGIRHVKANGDVSRWRKVETDLQLIGLFNINGVDFAATEEQVFPFRWKGSEIKTYTVRSIKEAFNCNKSLELVPDTSRFENKSGEDFDYADDETVPTNYTLPPVVSQETSSHPPTPSMPSTPSLGPTIGSTQELETEMNIVWRVIIGMVVALLIIITVILCCFGKRTESSYPEERIPPGPIQEPVGEVQEAPNEPMDVESNLAEASIRSDNIPIAD